MKQYREIVEGYRKRRRDTMVDALATGLTYVDELAVETGLLEEADLLTELTDSISGALPFVIIAATEGTKVILGRKPMKTGAVDGAYRMAKTTAALGVGAAVMSSAGVWAALPATMGVRALFDRYKSKAMTGMRVQGRIDRLHELNAHLRRETAEVKEPECLPGEMMAAEGAIE